MFHVEKRRAQRVAPAYPIQARLAGAGVWIVDLSANGVGVEHDAPLTTDRPLRLEFSHMAEKFSLSCELVRSNPQSSRISVGSVVVLKSGLRFADADDPSREPIRRLVAALILRSMEKQETAEAELKIGN